MPKSKIPIAAAAVLMLPPFGGIVWAEDAPAPAAPAATPAPAPTSTPAPAPPATTPAPAAPKAAPSASGGTTLPSLEVDAPRLRQTPRKPKVRVANGQRREAPEVPQQTPTEILAGKNDKFDSARQNLIPPGGATVTRINHQAIEALPQGNNTPLDKVLLQLPGVTQDSAASGELHVRNEHGNVQYRINGIMLPDGVGAFGQILDTGIVGTLALLTGALPAQYGFRTAGVVDIQTKTGAFNNSGSVSLYGGSHGTITPSFEYGGTTGQTQYFLSGRFTQNNLGIENPTPAYEAIHDRTNQEKGFAYVSTVLDPTSRLTYLGGVSNATFQIPNRPGQPPNFTAFGVSNLDSASLNEHQHEFNQFNVVAYQKSA